MQMRVNHFGRGSIGRRLIALFLLAALVPLLLFALYSLSKVSTELRGVRQAELVQMSKGYSMGVADRIRRVERLLSVSAGAGGPFRSMNMLEPYLDQELSGAMVVSNGRVLASVGRPANSLDVTRAAAKPKLAIAGSDKNSPMQLSFAARFNGMDATIVATIREDYLWGGAEELPHATDIVVLSAGGEVLHQSRPLDPNAISAVYERYRDAAHSGALVFNEGDAEALHVGYWILSLTTLGGGDLVVAASQPASYVNAAVNAFNRAFIPIALFAALGAALLAFTQIRRLLQPLDALKAAALRLAQNDFSAPVLVNGSNEFVAVGGAFNAMAGQIGRQLVTLNRYAEMDRIVLTKLDMPAVVEKALREILAITGASSAAILLKDAQDESIRRYVLSGPDDALVHESVQGFSVDMLSFNWHETALVKPSETSLWKGSAKLLSGRVIGEAVRPVGLLLVSHDSPLESGEAVESQIEGFLDRVAIARAAEHRERLLVQQARSDSLTGLPNRLHFLEMLESAVETAIREKRNGVLLFLDLDHFKRANDVLGHLAGDAVLKMTAERLRAATRAGDLLARLGGDEFTLLSTDNLNDAQVEVRAQALIESLSRPFQVEGRSVFVGLSVGSVRFPQDGRSALDLLRRADTAMYHAKKSGGVRHAVFRPTMEEEAQGSLALDQSLRDALLHEQFQLYYQAQVAADGGMIVGAEALIRWITPEGIVRGPDQWIPYAERTPLIHEIGGWALSRACMQMRTWDDAGCRVQRIAVNIAARQLEDEHFYTRVVQALQHAALPPHRLELEITESQLMASPEQGIAVLRRLAALGIAIAVDDFGTGYSSFSQLRQLPLSVLKVDRSLVHDIDNSEEASAVLLAIIQMAHALRFTVVAEGVETAAEHNALRRFGCDAIQGYLSGVPVPGEAFASTHFPKVAGRTSSTARLQVVSSKPPN